MAGYFTMFAVNHKGEGAQIYLSKVKIQTMKLTVGLLSDLRLRNSPHTLKINWIIEEKVLTGQHELEISKWTEMETK